MQPIVRALITFIATLFRSRLSLQLEIVALRQADGVSEIGSAATHSTSRPYSLVLDFAALVQVAGGCPCRKPRACDRMKRLAIRLCGQPFIMVM
jgi:hypothetical protein